MTVLLAALAFWLGAGLTPEQAYGIAAVAYGQYGGPRSLLEKLPAVHIVPQNEICAMMQLGPGCSYIGVYDEERIYVSDRLDFSTVFGASVLVHEFVHHFQHKERGSIGAVCPLIFSGKNGVFPISRIDYSCRCSELSRREAQAYRIQAYVLERSGAYVEARAVAISGRRRFC